MKRKTVTFEDGTELTLKSATSGDYYNIMNNDSKLAEKSKQLIFASIESWNFKDKDGKEVAKTQANADKFITADLLKKLNEAVEEVNNLTSEEKKTS